MFANRTARLLSSAVLAGAIALGLPTMSVAAGPLKATEAKSAISDPMPQLQVGARGAYVLALQARLSTLGYPLQGTGYFGPETKKVVIDWQRAQGINASGIVGPQTWQSFELCGKPTRYAIPTLNLQPGQQLTAAQRDELGSALSALGAAFPGWGDLPSSSVYNTRYDDAEVKLVKNLQKRAGIPATGVIGPWTTRTLSLVQTSICIDNE